jgi:hypothetical protein
MIIECIDNDGFEDQLTKGHGYVVTMIGNGGESFQVKNDKGDLRWYGEAKFEVVL